MIQLIKSVCELHRLRSLLDEEKHLPDGIRLTQYEDHALNEFLYFATFLECNCAEIAGLGQYSRLDILYSQYDWFTKFLARYESLFPKDEGMRQQQFQIMEAIDHTAEGEVDYELLEDIEKDMENCNMEPNPKI